MNSQSPLLEPSSFFGTKPNGEHIQFWNGGLSKGPLTLPFWITFASFSVTASGLSLALLWLGGTSSLTLSMQELNLNPWENPDINLSFRLELHPWRKWFDLFTLTGVVSSVTYVKPFFTCEWCIFLRHCGHKCLSLHELLVHSPVLQNVQQKPWGKWAWLLDPSLKGRTTHLLVHFS
jgi:hypothetical protein